MKVKESYICLENLKFYAYHGVSEQERTVGCEFSVTMRVALPLTDSMRSDNVFDTISYADIYKIVKTEMLTPSKLVENAAWRIASAVCDAYPEVKSVELKLLKKNPPMGASCDGAGVEICLVNDGKFMLND